MIRQESNVWLMHEPDAIWETMNTLPINSVNKGFKESYISELRQRDLVIRPNYTMTKGAQLHWWNARSCGVCDRSVTEGAIQAKTGQLDIIRGDPWCAVDIQKHISASMHGVWECNWLFRRVVEPKYRKGKIEPRSYDEDDDCNHHTSDGKTTGSNYRYKNLYPGWHSAF
jgi:hypothetical protein